MAYVARTILTSGTGQYHTGALTIPSGTDSTYSNATTPVATTTVSSTGLSTQNRGSFITTSAASANPVRTASDPFNNGKITYTLTGTSSVYGFISQVQSANVYITFSTGATSNLAPGLVFWVYPSPGGAMGMLGYGSYFIISVTANGSNAIVTLANSYANYLTGTAVVFATTSAGNASGYTWTDNLPGWYLGSRLPAGVSFTSGTTGGTISGNYTVNQTAGGAGINPDVNVGGVYTTGGVSQSNANLSIFQVTATTANNFTSSSEYFSVRTVVPYEFRQILTTCYIMGGYKLSVSWTNVNKCTAATDTNIDTGSPISTSQAYTMGPWSWNYAYCMGASGSYQGSSNVTIAWNMRTEAARTTNFNATWYDTVYNNAFLQQEYYYAWGTNGSTIREFNLSTETNNGTPSNQTGSGASASAGSHEILGIWNGPMNVWTYATRTGSTQAGSLDISDNTNGKVLQNKNPSSYQWGRNGDNTWRYTSMVTTVTTGSTGLGIPGAMYANEENHTNGQDWGYCIGFYNGNTGVHVTNSYKWIFASQTGVANTTNYQGQLGCSSGWGANRD